MKHLVSPSPPGGPPHGLWPRGPTIPRDTLRREGNSEGKHLLANMTSEPEREGTETAGQSSAPGPGDTGVSSAGSWVVGMSLGKWRGAGRQAGRVTGAPSSGELWDSWEPRLRVRKGRPSTVLERRWACSHGAAWLGHRIVEMLPQRAVGTLHRSEFMGR